MPPLTPQMIAVILSLVTQYGPDVVTGIENLFTKTAPTIDDVKAVFAGLKPYDAFGIKDIGQP